MCKTLIFLIFSTVVSSNSGHAFLDTLLQVFEPGVISAGLKIIGENITENCEKDMLLYLDGLKNRELWALKAYDATGRYSSNFFWGNNYWVGSETLCKNIGLARKHFAVNGHSPDIEKTNQTQESLAPIEVGYYKVKLLIKPPPDLSPPRSILIGLCLPLHCMENDVKEILKISITSQTANNYARTAKVQNIRTPHYSYDYWKDPIYWILIGVAGTMCMLITIGTLTEVYLDRKTHSLNLVNYASHSANTLDKFRNQLTHNGRTVTGRWKNDGNHNRRWSNLNQGNAISNSTKYGNSSNSLMTTDGSSFNSESESERGIWVKVILSFSLISNLKSISDPLVGADTIPTIHGIRSISMAWVILGHTCIIIFKYSDNMEYRTIIERAFFFQTINNAPFSVDSFFFISGLLVSFLYFRTTAKIDVTAITKTSGFVSNVIQFFGLILYRFCRLTAPYLFVLGWVQVSMKWFYHNSVFDPPTEDHDNCPKYWWRNALYINTLFPVQEMCMLWSWYLADDTQFYILGLALLILAIPHFKMAASLFFTFLVSSWVTTGYVAYVNNHKPSEDDPLTLFDKIYDKPWTRLGPYLIGMMVGWILFKTNCRIKMSKIAVCVGWLLSLSCMASLVYGLYDTNLDRLTSSAYSSLSHSAWALGLAWIVIACSTGHGGIINSLLSTSVLYPFSRVTYCAYLVHPIVIRQIIITMDSPMHLSTELVLILYLGVMSMSYIIAFVISLMFEAPVVSLLRLLSPNKNKKPAG